MFPRFMKWDIGKLLSKGQGLDLSGLVNFQVCVLGVVVVLRLIFDCTNLC
ncbi:hypothetical protein HYC85_025320 [Camellia sinensis]|uniref:Uncharacterized protein n=1 Tax=Camellia sinensis TaxID=4442 RepID=A0A7J7GEG6_CAMSI|nr:hypothetical protein HYC85_025320 [Camellia sinensis]